MAHQHQWHLNGDNDASALNKREVISIFMATLAEIYTVKSHLLDYLPAIANETTGPALKLAIIDTRIDIKAQLLRLDAVMELIKHEAQTPPQDTYNDFNLNNFLRSGPDTPAPYKTDVALLTHLILIENIQVTAFTLMSQMSHAFENKAIKELIKDNLADAKENQEIFTALMNYSLAKATT